MNNEVIQYVSASRGIPYRFSINRQSQYRTYIKLGTLPLPADVGPGESKVIFFVYGGMNFGDREESVHIGTVSTRGSVKASLRNIIGKRELQIGCVTTDSNVEVWLHHTNNYLGTTTIDVVASSQFSYTMQPTSSAPANVTWLNSEQVVTTSDLAAVATSGNYDDLINKPNIPEGTEVDTTLSTTSVNPVQNKVITSALNTCATRTWVQQQGYLTSVPAQSWSSITGKPKTFTPSAHTHGSDDVTALTGYSEGTATTTLSATMTLNAALASLQNQVQAKAASSHTHTASNITSGTLAIARIPTGTTSSTVALGNHTHSQYLTSSSLNGYATQSWVEDQGYLTSAPSYSVATSTKDGLVRIGFPESGKNYPVELDSSHRMYVNVPWTDNNTTYSAGIGLSLSGTTFSVKTGYTTSGKNYKVTTDSNGNLYVNVPWKDTTYSAATTSSAGLMSAEDKAKLDGIEDSADAVSIDRNLTSGTRIATITINGSSTALYAPAASTSTDTKNTTGTSNSTSKLYLAGGTTQSDAGVQTYSNVNVYTRSGQLYATQMNATNGFYETSDARLKDFKDDIKALDVVSEIPTKYFTWKSDESKTEHIGTSAQEIQKLYPDLVTENEEGELSVDYARLSIIALAAIKELKKEIDELKSKIN